MKGGRRMKGKHYKICIQSYPNCLCTTCVRDHLREDGTGCCAKYIKSCEIKVCLDYVKEEK